MIPMQYSYEDTSIIELLEQAARTDRGYVLLDGDKHSSLSYACTLSRAKQAALQLTSHGLRRGDCLILLLPTSEELIVHYFAALILGAVPCIQPTPWGRADQNHALRALTAVVDRTKANLILVRPEDQIRLDAHIPGVAVISPGCTGDECDEPLPDCANPADIALYQASSGTTSDPKVIALSHRNVTFNCWQIGEHFGFTERDVMVSWLPLYHDMGLIGCLLSPLYWKMECVLMPSSMFLRNPMTWMRAISTFRGTVSPAPNFAYARVAQRISADRLQGLDLSCWRLAICGAERIVASNLRRFTELLSPAGFCGESVVPAYGLAEATLLVTGVRDGRGVRTQRHPIRESDAPPGKEEVAIDQVCCGQPACGTTVAILDASGAELPSDTVGRICIKGPSIMQGYLEAPGRWRRPATDNGLLDTGDLGYLSGGELYVTGRSRDLLILRGVNYAPEVFEEAVAELDDMRGVRCIALSEMHGSAQAEALHLFVEGTRTQIPGRIAEQIARHVASVTGVLPAAVSVIQKKSIPATTSGKVQRQLFRQLYRAGKVAIVSEVRIT